MTKLLDNAWIVGVDQRFSFFHRGEPAHQPAGIGLRCESTKIKVRNTRNNGALEGFYYTDVDCFLLKMTVHGCCRFPG